MNLTDAIRCDVGLQGILLQLCCCCCGGDTPLLFCSGSCGTKLVSFAVSMIARARFPDSANTAVGNSCTAARVCGHRPAATFTTASCLGFIVTLQETPPRGVPRRASRGQSDRSRRWLWCVSQRQAYPFIPQSGCRHAGRAAAALTEGRHTWMEPSKPEVATTSPRASAPGTAPACPHIVCVCRATKIDPKPRSRSSSSCNSKRCLFRSVGVTLC